MQPIIDFMDSHGRNQWLRVGKMSMYVRRARRNIGGLILLTFDVASVEVDERYRGKGLFTAFLSDLLPLATAHGFNALYVESVLNERLGPMLEREGFTLALHSNPPSYYRLTGV